MQAVEVHIKHLNKNYHTCNDILSILYLYKYVEKMFKALYIIFLNLIQFLIQAVQLQMLTLIIL